MENQSEKFRFPGTDGEELAARLDLPVGVPRAYALFAHCFTCSKESHAATRISRALAAEGIAVLRFDFTGLGGSSGDFANTNFSSNVADLVAAADFLRQRYAAPKLLIGHSLGGAAVLTAAAHLPESVAVSTIGAPYHASHVRRLLRSAAPDIEAHGEAEVTLAGRTFRIKKQFLDDIDSHNAREAIAALRKALLIFHSPRDAIVNIDNAAQIFTAAKHPKSFVSLDDADHLLTRKADATYVAVVLVAWATRFLADSIDVDAHATTPPNTLVVEETGEGKFAQNVRVGRHLLQADEPREFGGDDRGPTPYDFLLAGLGACTSMTVRMYANLKQMPLEKVTVWLSHDKIHAQDCTGCESKEGKIDKIEREIELKGPLDASARAKLLEIADKCPVHRTLHSEVYVATKLRSL